MADSKPNKCAHQLCTCMARPDNKYCSDACSDAAKAGITDIECGCGHPGCGGKA